MEALFSAYSKGFDNCVLFLQSPSQQLFSLITQRALFPTTRPNNGCEGDFLPLGIKNTRKG